MNLRDQLLAHLREPAYAPANEYDLARRLGLTKKQRAMLAHEVRAVLKSGEFTRAQNGRIAKRGTKDDQPRTAPRPIFTPTKRGGAKLPPPDAPLFDAKKPSRPRAPDAPPRSRAPEPRAAAPASRHPSAPSAPSVPSAGR